MEAAERARVVAEFQQRRREAAVNKARGQAQWLGPPLPTPRLPKQTPSPGMHKLTDKQAFVKSCCMFA